jgi:hypothetical protein
MRGFLKWPRRLMKAFILRIVQKCLTGRLRTFPESRKMRWTEIETAVALWGAAIWFLYEGALFGGCYLCLVALAIPRIVKVR